MIVSILFRCLIEWLSSTPRSVMRNPNIALRVSEVIEEAIHVSCVGADSAGGSSVDRGVSNEQDADFVPSHERKESSIDDKDLTNMFKSIRSQLDRLVSEPPIEEEEDEVCQIFTHNDQAILSLIDNGHGTGARIIMRDSTGKYAWDIKPFYRSLAEVELSMKNQGIASELSMDQATLSKPVGTCPKFKFNDDIVFVQAPVVNPLSDSYASHQSTATGRDALEEFLLA
eukprot:jgi/Hompol1/5361/HPOL_000406-RA